MCSQVTKIDFICRVQSRMPTRIYFAVFGRGRQENKLKFDEKVSFKCVAKAKLYKYVYN